MIAETKSITASDGVARSFDYKVYPNEIRVYAVRGDITNADALKESAQELAIQHRVTKVTMRM